MNTLCRVTAVVATGLLLVACAPGPDSVSSVGPGVAPSGITASNGGGARATGNLPSVSVGNGQATVGGVPNGRGNAY